MTETQEIEIKFGFDPYQSETLKEIINDPIALSLWAMWKRNHIVSQLFLDEVIEVARQVRIRKPQCAIYLRHCFRGLLSYEFTISDVAAFTDEWFAVLSGERKIFIVIGGKRIQIQFHENPDPKHEIERLPD